MNHKTTAFFKRASLIIAFLMVIAGIGNLPAQPTNYCNTCAATSCPPGYMYSYVWCYAYSYGWTYRVEIKDLSGNLKLERVTTPSNAYINQPIPASQGFDGNGYFFVNDREAQLNPGSQYILTVGSHLWYNWGYYNQRIWIDWNQNGDFNQAGERINPSQWSYYEAGPYNMTPQNYTFTVPLTAPMGKTRMRVISAYYMYDYGPCYNGYSYLYAPYYCYNYGYYGECEDYIINIIGGIADMFPRNGDVLYAQEAYDGTTRIKNGVSTDFKKPTLYLTNSQPAGTLAYYKIVGPLPATDTIWRGTSPNPPYNELFDVSNTTATYTASRAIGTSSYPSDPGNGSFYANRGGEYRGIARVTTLPVPGLINNFTVAWDNDLSARDVPSPRTNMYPVNAKYTRGQNIDVKVTFQNTGLNTVTEFEATVNIYNSNGDRVYSNSIHYLPTQPGIAPGAKIDITFASFRSFSIGIYHVEATCNLLSATDQEPFNNRFPRQGTADYTFEIQYEFEVQANKILKPTLGEVLIGARPFVPVAEYKNNGIGDVSDIPSRFIIKNLTTGQEVYNNSKPVQEIASGRYNTKVHYYDPVAVKQSGNYEAKIIITYEDDVVRTNDTLTQTFSVIAGLSGQYTVGAGGAFKTIDEAMDALYNLGMVGPVTFVLTDAAYDVRSKSNVHAAWDFSSKIIGLGYDSDTKTYNTLTIKPSAARANIRGGVYINLYAYNGIGILFGQSNTPSNQYAVFNQFQSRENANSAGYITFDGGAQKAFRFNLMSTNSVFGSAFYLAKGSSNITIKNCLIENGVQALSNKILLPLVSYIPTTKKYRFDFDSTSSPKNGYSAGIVIRSTLQNVDSTMVFGIKFDTLPNTNNLIDNNEIQGFAYGVVDLGMGPLFTNSTIPSDFHRFHNQNNRISRNIITSCGAAGIIVGFEENTDITMNRIYNIGDGTLDAAGIIAGGFSRGAIRGYNNVNLRITGNEISGITSPTKICGIRVEQVQLSFQKDVGIAKFPNTDESTLVANNLLWGLLPNGPNAEIMGIHLLTQRATSGNFLNPFIGNYMSRSDKVVNNTVLIEEDGQSNMGSIAGIALQQVRGAIVKNNAVYYNDALNTNNVDIASAFFFEGLKPDMGSITSNRNAVWTGSVGSEVADIYRYVETDTLSRIVEPGSRGELMRLSQWQSWTGQDQNSVIGDFTTHFFKSSNVPQNLRINLYPEPPIGSILNNRGERLSYVTNDLDNNVRGPAGQQYDIGAMEFAGTLYNFDVEMMSFSSPANYQATTGTYSDAEYIMTNAPVQVKANMRNNGSQDQNNATATLQIYRENPDGVTFGATPVLTDNATVSVGSGGTAELVFNRAPGTQFNPQTYGDLRPAYNGNIALQFTSMEANVTPRYMIKITVPSDLQNTNNIIIKYVRFYLKRSWLSLCATVENSFENYLAPTATTDIIAGRLNSDSVTKVLAKLGWFTDLTANPKRYDLDLFDRKGWEPKAVNYSLYRSLIWSDGDDKALSRYQIKNINDFLTNTAITEKKNLLICSQEMLRLNESVDTLFTQGVLRARRIVPNINAQDNPLGFDVSNDNNFIRGLAVGRGTTNTIKSTVFATDAPPYCGMMRVFLNGEGLARPGMSYGSHTASAFDSLAGVATTTMYRNIIYTGVDWRHLSDVETMFRAALDFIETNEGSLVPVELSDFQANGHGKRVDISWTTAQEIGSARFEVEKSVASGIDNTPFVKISEMNAAGKSEVPINYGPVMDYNVQFGHTYIYRLKIIDQDGTTNYSGEKVVTLTGNQGAITISQPMPNPAENNVKFDVTLENEANVSIDVYDISGKLMETVVNGMLPNQTTTIEINVKNYTNGTYNAIIKSGDAVITRTITILK
ncbi:MAG: hypothetical protein HW421_478 [Ignavibacteria bacterium]|nr:hypothetical protein [Ignavibacteria bacterium]